jgi:hypothetical protein
LNLLIFFIDCIEISVAMDSAIMNGFLRQSEASKVQSALKFLMIFLKESQVLFIFSLILYYQLNSLFDIVSATRFPESLILKKVSHHLKKLFFDWMLQEHQEHRFITSVNFMIFSMLIDLSFFLALLQEQLTFWLAFITSYFDTFIFNHLI